MKPVQVLRAVPENAAIPKHDRTVSEGPGLAADLAPDIASEIATNIASEVSTEVPTEMAPEVAQVELVVVTWPPFDFDGHVGRRAIARDLELERIARLRVPHRAGEIGRGLDMLAFDRGVRFANRRSRDSSQTEASDTSCLAVSLILSSPGGGPGRRGSHTD